MALPESTRRFSTLEAWESSLATDSCPGLEQILETYYSYALTSSTHLSVDYQFIANHAYNTERGPVNIFAGRIHWQF